MDPNTFWTSQAPPQSQMGTQAPPTVFFGNQTPAPKAPVSRIPPPSRIPSASSYRHTNTSSDSIPQHADATNTIPLSLKAQQLTLEESKTYMRWYSDILARTNSRTVSISDVYQFLSNFKISAAIKEKTNRIFAKLLHSLNIGEFFALLRLISHALQGREPDRALIAIDTSVPTPPSILSKKRLNDDTEDDEAEPDPGSSDTPSAQLDLDSFTQFMLTGERPDEKKTKKRSKKLKSVKFSDQIVTDIKADASVYDYNENSDYLSMDQLMDRMKNKTSLAVPFEPPVVSSPDPEEKKLLKEMEPQINHFQNLNSVDTISVDGVPSSIHLGANSSFRSPRELSPQPQYLKPNMTGPAQMASMGYDKQSSGDWNNFLQPNITGPADMARLLSPSAEPQPAISLQSFSEQMTGNTLANTYQNSAIGAGSVGNVNPDPGNSFAPQAPNQRRSRSVSQPSPLNNTGDGSLFPNQYSLYDRSSGQNGVSSPGPPVPPRITSERSPKPAPPPPPRSRRTASSFSAMGSEQGPPLPDKVPNQVYQNTESSSSTANILDDLKALQEEVDRIRDMSGGF